MQLHDEITIGDLMDKLPKILKDDIELLEKCYRERDIFNPVFDYFEPDVKMQICAGYITDEEAQEPIRQLQDTPSPLLRSVRDGRDGRLTGNRSRPPSWPPPQSS